MTAVKCLPNMVLGQVQSKHIEWIKALSAGATVRDLVACADKLV